MYNFLSKIFDRLDRGLSPRDKSIIVAILLVVSVLSIVLGVRYYDYIQNSPEFCGSCHLMEEAHRDWKLSSHNTIMCQDCHHLTMLEQNRLLVKFVFTSDRSPEAHGVDTPWKFCMQCHWDAAAQGAISVDRSTGHARHIAGEKLVCKDCHSRHGHSFHPEDATCLRCHQDFKVHGVGMQEIACVRCHPFSPRKQEPFLPDRTQCLSCHGKTKPGMFPTGVPMARLNCYECHKPHRCNDQPSDSDCLRCHTRELLKRKEVHRTTSRCISCHAPHLWTAR